ncbi:hypothetical protein EFA69_16120 [Rufibacter immobilis]|uniref:Uncharacterized protein n=1 Tax=Rufibacter immobilis TaxID=1348778 RepID=A0A3M9MRX9_9BACT|nr:hypothetical protein [Rufibacter immobilis]RNI27643.1 hypothetical protein EFA69_16120 [Rufibacter immobilis]
MHNFRKHLTLVNYTAVYFCSKAGSDSNPGTSPDAPKASVSQVIFTATNAGHTGLVAIIIGEGVYEESINVSQPSLSVTYNIIAEGKVVFKASGSNQFIMTRRPFNFLGNFEFRNYQIMRVTDNSSGSSFNCNGAKLRNCTLGAGNYAYTFTNCVLEGVVSSVVAPKMFGCKVFNSQITGISPSAAQLDHTYNNDFDEESVFTIRSTDNTTNHNFNNLRGKIRVQVYNTAGYEGNPYITYNSLQELWAGNPTSNPPKPAYPGHFPNSFSANPEYNSKELGDYTVKASSPNLRTGATTYSNGNIGNVELGIGTYIDSSINGRANIDPDNPNAFFSPELQIIGDAVSVPLNQTLGYIEEDWLQVNGGALGEIEGVDLFHNLEFNTSYVGPNIANMNVPDYYNGQPHDGANLSVTRNPNRLSFQMMWSSQVNKPGNGAEAYAGADNGGLLAPATWGVFYYFDKPLVDLAGVCSGMPGFDAAANNARAVTARWIKRRYWLRNDYTS